LDDFKSAELYGREMSRPFFGIVNDLRAIARMQYPQQPPRGGPRPLNMLSVMWNHPNANASTYRVSDISSDGLAGAFRNQMKVNLSAAKRANDAQMGDGIAQPSNEPRSLPHLLTDAILPGNNEQMLLHFGGGDAPSKRHN
uniref:DUF1501 domain-containing protein n=1 Tax=Gongylonema pulchrum TaxID=637853 RepID=A0A183CYV0_9BILA